MRARNSGKTFEAIGNDWGITRERVRQVVINYREPVPVPLDVTSQQLLPIDVVACRPMAATLRFLWPVN